MTKRIGLTGNIGSGKTTVCKLFESLDVPVYYADQQAKSFLKAPAVIDRIQLLFGQRILGDDGTVDRKKLAEVVFHDPHALARLNEIIHPLVREDYEKWQQSMSASPYTIQEAAILFETGHHRNFDHIVVVSAPESLRIKRVRERDGVSEAAVRQRMKHQMDQGRIEQMADYVIVNDDIQALVPQVLKLDHALRNA